MWMRASILFAVTTDPTNRVAASPHSGGWSEGFWQPAPFLPPANLFQRLLLLRQRLLPEQASIIGFRLASYTPVGNRLVPGGSSTGKLNMPGLSGAITDLPQVSLMMSGPASNGPNQSRFSLRCIPDSMMTRGEYQPTPNFALNVSIFGGVLENFNWHFLGRDLTQPSELVESLAAGVLTLSDTVGAVPGVDSIRLRGVKDSLGQPISGAFRVLQETASGVYVMSGLAGKVAGVGGAARVDKPMLMKFENVKPSRAVARKIGRPFEAYRGRA